MVSQTNLSSNVSQPAGRPVRDGPPATLHDRGIDFNGILQTSGKLSDTTSGVKTVMLKILGPLWPKRSQSSDYPIIPQLPVYISSV
jgi:hypothetical protein